MKFIGISNDNVFFIFLLSCGFLIGIMVVLYGYVVFVGDRKFVFSLFLLLKFCVCYMVFK